MIWVFLGGVVVGVVEESEMVADAPSLADIAPTLLRSPLQQTAPNLKIS